MKRADLFFNVLRLPVDFGMILLAGVVTYLARTTILAAFRPVLFEVNLPLAEYVILVLFAAVLFLASYAVSGLYLMNSRDSIAEELLKILIASSASILAVIMFIFLRQELFNSRFLVIGGWFFAMLFVFIGRLGIRRLKDHLIVRRGFGVHKIMVIGDDEVTSRVTQALSQDPLSGYRVVKHLSNPEVREVKLAVGNPGVDEVLLANPNYPAPKIVELVEFCHENHIVFKFVPNIYQTLTTHFAVDAIASVPVIELRRTPLDGWGKVFKRSFDIVAASAGLLLLSPLLALIAFAVKWETAGPVFVKLRRVSRNKEFDLFKFRGMIENAEELKPYLAAYNERSDGPLFKMKDDPRVTGVGRFIRKYRLDELPQFINILRGDISLVGPRPHQPDEISRYEKRHKRVLAIPAGATGLAQVSGSSDLTFDEEVDLDSFYIENWSLGMDLRIIIRTVLKMLRDRSAV